MQWILGHAQLTTTQIYLAVPAEDVIESALAITGPPGARQAGGAAAALLAGLPAGDAGRSVRAGAWMTAHGGPRPGAACSRPGRAVGRSRAGRGCRRCWSRFPARVVPASWAATGTGRAEVLGRLLARRSAPANPDSQRTGGAGWSGSWTGWSSNPGKPGRNAGSPAAPTRPGTLAGGLLAPGGCGCRPRRTAAGPLQASARGVAADLRRRDPAQPELAAEPRTPREPGRRAGPGPRPGRVRGADGAAATAEPVRRQPTATTALYRVAVIVAAKGGLIGDITVGDCLELLGCAIARQQQPGRTRQRAFYQLLHAMGVFPAVSAGDACGPSARPGPAQPRRS